MGSSLSGSSETIRMLKTYEKDLYKDLGNKLNSQLRPILGPIKGQINGVVTNQLKSRRNAGMFSHSGRTSWGGVDIKVKTSVNPKNLIFIEGKGPGSGDYSRVGFNYAELAGIRRKGPRPISKGWNETSAGGYHAYFVRGQGDAFIKMLNQYGKPGRFLWKRVLNNKPKIEEKVMNIAESLNLKITRRLATSTSNKDMEVK